jgi:hypothetical protein
MNKFDYILGKQMNKLELISVIQKFGNGRE